MSTFLGGELYFLPAPRFQSRSVRVATIPVQQPLFMLAVWTAVTTVLFIQSQTGTRSFLSEDSP
jgi:hypothetical protein